MTSTQTLTSTSDSARSPATSGSFSVVYIIDRLYFDLGGTEGQVMKLVHGLHPRLRMKLIVLEDSEWLRSFRASSPLDIEVISLAGGIRSLSFWRGFRTLTQRLREVRPDVVHTFFPIANILGALAGRLAGVPAVVGSRRDYGYWMTPGYVFFTKLANRLVSRIVTNSPEVKRFTVDKEGYRAEQIEVIFNGLDLDALQTVAPDLALKAQLGIPAHHRVVVLVANFKSIKRQDSLVRALARVRAERDDVSVLFIGSRDNSYAPVVEAVVRDVGMEAHVFYAHAKGDIHRYLSFADIGCNCSESEGLSNAVMEYMATGVACVVSDGGGNKDLVQHGVTGLVYPVGDDAQLARHLLQLLGDDALRRQYAQAGRDMVFSEMSLPVILDRYDHFYRHLHGSNA